MVEQHTIKRILIARSIDYELRVFLHSHLIVCLTCMRLKTILQFVLYTVAMLLWWEGLGRGVELEGGGEVVCPSQMHHVILFVSGTGVVTSVPSDAPDDYAALRDVQKKAVSSYRLDCFSIEWSPSNQDTINFGPSTCVWIIEVSSFQGLLIKMCV